ncbi:hypothetical protein LEP1GSC193_3430 [Leptospira alstonii serovar Pingchang str. 80-412]|uniref:Uncharacterized protein n=2 Tax=Leptospira alstonii TaxID=28452 RepID=M6CIT1_9LEPT|nr:hypothetical protein LEP1GSC194_3897 [Leptospira alstonii serovar Sichuan str. 79601]EQA82101.1 hypothetical protein LEP1GSC193_3430 [Leptospira alstonii serovar Pingchang str. 80-412]
MESSGFGKTPSQNWGAHLCSQFRDVRQNIGSTINEGIRGKKRKNTLSALTSSKQKIA